MSKPMVRIHNLETDEVIDREMTDDEFAKYSEHQEKIAALQAEVAAKALAKQSLLERLGITEAEAKLLLG